MFDITYCGYVNFLMVLIFVSSLILVGVVIMLFMVFLSNFGLLMISLKIFNVGFFGDLEFMFSPWNFLFLLLVLLISGSVIIFSLSYMSGLLVSNFILLYFGFIFSMIWLILNNNFYWMMLGWDGSGVVSFLLIVFYYNCESINNGLFTLFQNRIGDLFFVMFMLGGFSMLMSTSIIVKFGLVFLIIGSCVKSAQFPFNSWLLSAMSAPTPISSLVHSSTLVVAGVYILLQFSYCLVDVLSILKFISIFTLLVSSFGLLNEADMKKLIAYSTMSHVSLMMYLLSFGLYKVVYFHLNIHAMFKSLMFMCFGFVMLSSYHSQDKRLVTLMNLNPMIKMVYYFSCLCLAGLPFLSGFFSKDFMIEKFMEFSIEVLYIVLLLLFLSISIYYSMKLLLLSSCLFVYSLVEKSYVGMFSIFLMMMVSIILINVYIFYIVSLSLEMLSFKLSIYFLVVIFFFLSILTNLNFKLGSYDKMKNFMEVWILNYYFIDKFMYWNIFLVVSYFGSLSLVKLIVLMNWWVLVVMLGIF